MKCPVCDREHLIGDPCHAKAPKDWIGLSIDLCKCPRLINWITKKVKRWKIS